MGFTITFLKLFLMGLQFISPVLVALLVGIVSMGLIVGRAEGWSKTDSVYFSFITATTVGYGDFPPRRRISKILAIFIAFLGLIYTGIVVAAALNAVTLAFKAHNPDLNIKEITKAICPVDKVPK